MNLVRRQVHMSDAERLNAVASLGDPSRKRLFELLRASPRALSRDDCATALDMPRSTIRAQLDRLAEEKLLHVEYRKVGNRAGPGSGRPTKLYTVAVGEVTATVPARRYDLAAELLAAAVQRSVDTAEGVQEALAAVAYDAGKSLGAEAGSIHNVLANTGYEPMPDGAGGTIMANCPFHRLAQDHTGVVCALNASLLSGALAGCGDSSHAIAPDADVSHCCARLVTKI